MSKKIMQKLSILLMMSIFVISTITFGNYHPHIDEFGVVSIAHAGGGDDRYEDREDEEDDDDDRHERREYVPTSSTRTQVTRNNPLIESITTPPNTFLSDTATLDAFLPAPELLTTPEVAQPSQIMLNQPLTYYSEKLVERNLIDSTSDVVRQAFKDATRIEALDIILKSNDIPTQDSSLVYFADVNQNDPYAKTINTAVQRNIVSGFEDGTFRPNTTVKRSEILKILFNTYGFNLTNKSPQSKTFSDEDLLHWSAPYLELASSNGILNGYGNNTVGPNNNVTRGELAKIVLIAKQQSSEGFSFPPMMPDSLRATLIRQRDELNKYATNTNVQVAPSTPIPSTNQNTAPVTTNTTTTPVQTNNTQQVDAAKLAAEKKAAADKAAATQKLQQEQIAQQKAEAERLRLEQERIAAQKAAQLAAEKAAKLAADKAAADAAAARSRTTRRS